MNLSRAELSRLHAIYDGRRGFAATRWRDAEILLKLHHAGLVREEPVYGSGGYLYTRYWITQKGRDAVNAVATSVARASRDVRDRVERTGSVERHDARVDGASVWFYVDHDRKLVDVTSIRVPLRKQGAGLGRRALAYALSFADRFGYETQLSASPLDRRTSLDRLVRFYEREGFEASGERVNPLGHPKMRRAARDATKRFRPPADVVHEARRALEWRRNHKRGGTNVDARAEGYRPGERGYPSAGRIAWALWGGDAGRRWTRTVLRSRS